ncbi:unnamed protein product, partial [Sphacelaria rigidula]
PLYHDALAVADRAVYYVQASGCVRHSQEPDHKTKRGYVLPVHRDDAPKQCDGHRRERRACEVEAQGVPSFSCRWKKTCDIDPPPHGSVSIIAKTVKYNCSAVHHPASTATAGSK